MREVNVPDIGDFKEVEVIEVLVKPGDSITAEQSLITVESDKATMEIPAPGAGTVKEMRVKVGDKVSQGTPILVLDEDQADAAPKEKAAPTPEKPKPEPEKPAAAPSPAAQAAGPMTVKVPDIGDFKEVAVIEVLVKPGDTVAPEQSLITVESDKATMEIPSPAAGRITAMKLKVGDKVSEGSTILELELEAEGAAPAAPQARRPKAASAPAAVLPEAAVPPPPPVPKEPQEVAPPPRGRVDKPFRDQVDIDSFDFLNVVIRLHEKLGVDIPEADYGKLATLASTVDYLAARCGVTDKGRDR